MRIATCAFFAAVVVCATQAASPLIVATWAHQCFQNAVHDAYSSLTANNDRLKVRFSSALLFIAHESLYYSRRLLSAALARRIRNVTAPLAMVIIRMKVVKSHSMLSLWTGA